MSHCTECGAEMSDGDARIYEVCHGCRRGRKGLRSRVRTMYKPSSEESGRPMRSLHTLGGAPDGFEKVNELAWDQMD